MLLGLCVVTFSNPENNTVVAHFSGTVNVSFECYAEDDVGPVAIAWNIGNFRGVESHQAIRLILPDTILEGNSTVGTREEPFFDNFRTTLIFPVFLEDFDLATLACGTRENDPSSALFPLRVYGKYIKSNLQHEAAS